MSLLISKEINHYATRVFQYSITICKALCSHMRVEFRIVTNYLLVTFPMNRTGLIEGFFIIMACAFWDNSPHCKLRLTLSRFRVPKFRCSAKGSSRAYLCAQREVPEATFRRCINT